MGANIENQVVSMEFNNKNFESNVKTSMSTLDALKKKLDFSGASKGMTDLTRSTNNMKFDGINSAIESVKDRFSTLGIVGMTVIQNLTNTVVDGVKKMMSSINEFIFQGGINRAFNIEQAKFQLEGLGVAWKDIVDDIDYGVKDTAYGLDSAAKAASQLVASGVQLGDDMKTSLRGISGLAAMTNSSYDDMARIFTTVAGNGRLMANELNQIGSRGLNGAAALTNYFNDINTGSKTANESVTSAVKAITNGRQITEQELRELVSQGKINFELFAAAMDSTFGEHAKAANKTFTGAMSNIKAAFSRIGAEFVTPWIQNQTDDAELAAKRVTNLVEVFNAVIPIINGVKQALTPIFGEYQQAVGYISDGIVKLLESVKLFDEITDKEGNTTKVLTKSGQMLSDIFVDIWNTIKNLASGIKSVLVPIGKAFQNVFPKDSLVYIKQFTGFISNLTSKMTLTSSNSERLQATFRGLFSIISILITVGKNLYNLVLRPVASAMGVVATQVLRLTGFLGDLLLDFDYMLLDFSSGAGYFKSFGDVISNVMNGIGSFIDSINLPGLTSFHNILEKIQIVLGHVGKGLGEVGDVLAETFSSKNTDGFVSFVDILSALGGAVYNVIRKIVGIFADLGSVIAQSLGEDKFKGLLDAFKIVGGVVLADRIRLVMLGIKNTISLFRPLKDAVDTIKMNLGDFNGILIQMQNEIKANIILKIAGAVAILAIALVAISSIPQDKLASSVAALSALIGAMSGVSAALGIFSKSKLDGGIGFFKGIGSAIQEMGKASAMATMASALVSFALAVAILAASLKVLSQLSWEEILKGLVAIGVLMAGLVIVAKQLDGTSFEKGAFGYILFAAAIKILASAVEDLASIPFGSLTKALGATASLMLGMTLVAKSLDKVNFKSTAVGMVIFAASMKIMASALEDISRIKSTSLIKALGTISVLLFSLSTFFNNAKMQVALTQIGKNMILMSVSMIIFAKAIEMLGAIPAKQIVKGLGAMAIVLLEIAGAMRIMPKNLPAIGAGLIIVGVALNVIAASLRIFAGLGLEGLVVGIVALGATLGILAAALYAMQGTLAGSAALLIAAAAIAVLAPALSLLGAMSWESIIKGLAALAGTFIVLGVAAALLSGLVPTILALSAAITLFGVAVLAFGAGLVLAGAGLTSIALGLTALATALTGSVTIIVAGLAGLIMGFIDLLPLILTALDTVFVGVLEIFMKNQQRVIAAATSLIVTICKAIDKAAPVMIDTVTNLILKLLDSIKTLSPQLVDTGFQILMDFLRGIRDNIQEIVTIASDIVLNFIAGLQEKIPDMIQAAWDFIISFIDGISNSIAENTPRLLESINNLVYTLIDTALLVIKNSVGQFFNIGGMIFGEDGFIAGIGDKANALFDKIRELLKLAIDRIKEKLEDFRTKGKELIEKLIAGVGDKFAAFKDKAKALVEAGKTAIVNVAYLFKNAGQDLVAGLAKGVEEKFQTVKDAAVNVVKGAVNAVKSFLGIASPSKLFKKIGGFMDSGLAIGLIESARKVTSSAKYVAKEAFNTMTDAINSAIDMLDDGDFSPVITPVLDISNIQNGINSIDSMFAKQQALSINSKMNGIGESNIDNVSNPASKQTVINFEQNNYSPKALSEIDIYRNTKNEISRFANAF